jgi:hypothetical protein
VHTLASNHYSVYLLSEVVILAVNEEYVRVKTAHILYRPGRQRRLCIRLTRREEWIPARYSDFNIFIQFALIQVLVSIHYRMVVRVILLYT